MSTNTPGRITIYVAAALIALVAVSAAVLYGFAMPVRAMPEPTGPAAVGTVVYDLTDRSRRERYAQEQPRPHRTIRLQLWYPAAEPTSEDAAGADPTSAEPSPWMIDGRRQVRAIVASHGFPSFLWDHTLLMDSNSYRSAPPASTPGASLPVVVISHGWRGYRGLHADLAEELASAGYLVAAADHSYGSAAVVLDDGRVLRSRPDILPDRDATDRFLEYAQQLVRTFAEDDRFILDHLERVQAGRNRQGPPFLAALEGRIDLTRTAAIGHSTGGGAAVYLALTDPRVDAVLGLDAWVEPIGSERLTRSAFKTPALFLRSEEWTGHPNNEYLRQFVDHARGAELHQTTGTTHEQFTMLYMYAPASRWAGLLGSVDPKAFACFQRRTARRFVQTHLRGGPAPALDADFVRRIR